MCDLPLFKETRTSISLAFVGKAYLIGSIGPEDGFRIVSNDSNLLFSGVAAEVGFLGGGLGTGGTDGTIL